MSVLTRLLMAGGGAGAFPLFPPGGAVWTRSPSNPILTATVAWEQTAVVEAMVRHEGGTTWKMWYRGGWSNQAVGYATSTDGIAWTKSGSNPVYGQGGSSMAGNDGGQPWVMKDGSTYYLYATNNDVPRVNVATSSDGIAWTTQSSTISLPASCTLWGNRTVWKEGSAWKMLQEAYHSSVWNIYLYTSSDGFTWSIGNSGSPLSTLQVHAGGAYGGPKFANVSGEVQPKSGGLYQLWYHAANVSANLPTNIYHATSPDLITWTISPATPVLTLLGTGFEIDQTAGPDAVMVGTQSYLFYDGDDNASATAAIGVALYP